MKTKIRNNAFLAHQEFHESCLDELKSSESLRTLLSKFLNVNQNISFRNNTTAILIDILQSINDDDYMLVYSDLEHPCIQNAIKYFYPKNKIIFIKLFNLLLKGDFKEIEKRLSISRKTKSIYLISHVLWNTGIKLDIEYMAIKIKKQNYDNIIIIDGAQSVGNVENIYSKNFNQNLIDFYLGCTHKWIGTKNLLGFVIVSETLMKKKKYLVNKIFLKDIFSSFAGDVKLLNLKWNTSTYDTIFLIKILNELNNIFSDFVFRHTPLVLNNIDKSKFVSIPNIEKRATRFMAVYGLEKDLAKICESLKINLSFLLSDKNLPNKHNWLRLGI